MNVFANILVLLHMFRKLEKLAVTNVVEQLHSEGRPLPLLRDDFRLRSTFSSGFLLGKVSLVENPVEREVDTRSDGFLYGLFQNGYFDNKGVDTEDYILSLQVKQPSALFSLHSVFLLSQCNFCFCFMVRKI